MWIGFSISRSHEPHDSRCLEDLRTLICYSVCQRDMSFQNAVPVEHYKLTVHAVEPGIHQRCSKMSFPSQRCLLGASFKSMIQGSKGTAIKFANAILSPAPQGFYLEYYWSVQLSHTLEAARARAEWSLPDAHELNFQTSQFMTSW